MEAFVALRPGVVVPLAGDRLRPADRRAPADGACRSGPASAPTTSIVGDAGGAINPFNGEGIAYGYETGRLAAASSASALAERPGATPSLGYERALGERLRPLLPGRRGLRELIGRPEPDAGCCVAPACTREPLMEWAAADHGEPAPTRTSRSRPRLAYRAMASPAELLDAAAVAPRLSGAQLARRRRRRHLGGLFGRRHAPRRASALVVGERAEGTS